MKNQDKLTRLRHSAAHLLAHAVLELFPNTLLTIGPATQEGFFFDFLPEKNFTDDDLTAIEKRMHEISERDLPITHKHIPKNEARLLYKDNPFKLELVDGSEAYRRFKAFRYEFYAWKRAQEQEAHYAR